MIIVYHYYYVVVTGFWFRAFILDFKPQGLAFLPLELHVEVGEVSAK